MSIGSIVRTGMHLIFNPKCESAIENGLKSAMKANKAAGKGKYADILSITGEQFKEVHKNFGKEAVCKPMWNSFKTIPKKIAQGWRVGGKLADKAGKTGLSKFWSQLKGLGKGLGSRMPVIGAGLMVAFELPNIFSAFKDKGLVGGVLEVGKSAGRLAGFMGGMAIGQALIPIPIVGGLIGGLLGDTLVSKIVGKSHSEKKAEAEQLAQAQMEQKQAMMQPQYAQAGAMTNPYGATMTPMQLAMMQQQLYGGGNFMNDDFMANASGINRMNLMA